jgi:hypothetical protein
MTTFVVDVDFSTHDALQQGVTSLGFRRFTVQAHDGDDASLVAAQWVAAAGVMPTRTMVHV